MPVCLFFVTIIISLVFILIVIIIIIIRIVVVVVVVVEVKSSEIKFAHYTTHWSTLATFICTVNIILVVCVFQSTNY